jgi:ABC-type transport system involved in cytochrome bd biosynthesis fused ATPase/permease subunit
MSGDPKPHDESRWPAVRRATILAAFIQKHVQFILLSDRRAQVIIAINAFLIPLVLSQVSIEEHRTAIVVFIAGCFVSVFAALVSLLPKKYSSDRAAELELFHFTGIQAYSEEEYMERVRRALEEDDSLSKYVAYDLYHISTCILRPKFLWIRVSYFAFSAGLILGASFFLLPFLVRS